MRNSILLVVAGVVFVAFGLGFAERSWGWTYGLVAIGVAVVVATAIRLARRTSIRRPERATR